MRIIEAFLPYLLLFAVICCYLLLICCLFAAIRYTLLSRSYRDLQPLSLGKLEPQVKYKI